VKPIPYLVTLLLGLLLVGGCGPKPTVHKVKTSPDHAAASASLSGTVCETMNAAGYTYVQVDTGSEKIWAAAPEFPVKVGDQVVVPEGAPMHNYHSTSLNRDFSLVYFVSAVTNKTSGTPAAEAPLPTGHPPAASSSTPPQIDLSGITKAKGGVTVGELYAGKAALSGKVVTLRGKVVKFLPQIMGKNWLHVRDGSGDANAHTNDLTVTSQATVKVGDTVLVNGKVLLNKDFGYGYKYDVIIEDAKVTLE
jgi:hypothetical protein